MYFIPLEYALLFPSTRVSLYSLFNFDGVKRHRSNPTQRRSSIDRNARNHKLPFPIGHLFCATTFAQRAVLLQTATERQVRWLLRLFGLTIKLRPFRLPFTCVLLPLLLLKIAPEDVQLLAQLVQQRRVFAQIRGVVDRVAEQMLCF